MTRWRMAFALVGFIIALLSVALNDRRLVWVAIILLAISLLLRLIVRRRESPR
jgi:uncharacterized membrane protein YeiB